MSSQTMGVVSGQHNMPPKETLLENGCGRGFFIDGLSSYFKGLVVLDFSLTHLIQRRRSSKCAGYATSADLR